MSNSYLPKQEDAQSRAAWAHRYLTSSHQLANFVAEKFRVGYSHLDVAERALLNAERTHEELVGHSDLFTDANEREAFEDRLHELRVKLDDCRARPKQRFKIQD